ncbi:MAG: hypothetical protein J6R48_00020 [Muribaculaceae bacterium]|nr:hypothetical protein [Muribaculaceae bacterium]
MSLQSAESMKEQQRQSRYYPLVVPCCTRCLGLGSGTVCNIADIKAESSEGVAKAESLLSPRCPLVYSLSRGRRWDSVQCRYYGDASVVGVGSKNRVTAILGVIGE